MNFVDAHTHAHHILYNRTYLAGLIFVVQRLCVITVKINLSEISHYMMFITHLQSSNPSSTLENCTNNKNEHTMINMNTVICGQKGLSMEMSMEIYWIAAMA